MDGESDGVSEGIVVKSIADSLSLALRSRSEVNMVKAAKKKEVKVEGGQQGVSKKAAAAGGEGAKKKGKGNKKAMGDKVKAEVKKEKVKAGGGGENKENRGGGGGGKARKRSSEEGTSGSSGPPKKAAKKEVEQQNKGKGKKKSGDQAEVKPKKAHKGKGKPEKGGGEGAGVKKAPKKPAAPKGPVDKKEDRQKQKERRQERQKKAKSEDVFQLGVETKKMWETLRREDTDAEERARLTEALHKEVQGKLTKLLFAHDTVRPLECLVAMGGERIRDELFAEVKDDLVAVSKAAYGHFFVSKLLKYGTKEQRAAILKAFEGRVANLTKHKVANNIVEALYNEYANGAQRSRILQEFCGPEFTAFKEEGVRTVAELIERHPVKKKDIVRHLGDNVSTLVQKGCYNHSVVHTVIYNYMQVMLVRIISF